MTYAQFHNGKNDSCFALLMAGILMVTVATGVAGYENPARDGAATDFAKVRNVSVALNGAAERASLKGRAGASNQCQRLTASGSSGPLAR